MVRALFVCSQNRLRSPTAEHVFSQYEGVECESAGVHESANVPLGPELIEWADIIFVMERAHRNKVAKKFKQYLKGKRVIVLDIPDEYEYMDESLVRLLKVKIGPFLGSQCGLASRLNRQAEEVQNTMTPTLPSSECQERQRRIDSTISKASACHMSDSKWRKLFGLLEQFPIRGVQWKFVHDERIATEHHHLGKR